jgi:multiple sugar transport system permease protein
MDDTITDRPRDTRTGSMTRLWNAFSRYIDRRVHLVMVLPMLLLLLSLVVYPVLYNLNLSTHRVVLTNIRSGDWPFVGLQNLAETLVDPFTQLALVRTAVFAVLTVGLQLALGMIAALAFNIEFPGKNVIMTLAIAPMMLTPVVVGLFWRILLNHSWGPINYFIGLIGIPPQSWLGDPILAFISVVQVQVWWGISFVFLVILAGLRSLPVEPFESAYIDGASRLQAFRYLTLPLLRPVLAVVGAIRLIDAITAFDLIYILTAGGPGSATRVFAVQVFNTAFAERNFGKGAAQAIMLAIVVGFFAQRLFRYSVQSASLD